MISKILCAAAILAALAAAPATPAQDGGYWLPASPNAQAITGEITLSGNKLTINFTTYTVADIRKLTPAEVASAFDADVNTAHPGELYRLRVPAEKRFLHHNTLCGSDDTQWMATYADGRNIQVLFLSGDATPVFTPDALANSTAVCGLFTYAR